MVAPERDTPGHRERHWKSPMARAFPKPRPPMSPTVVPGRRLSTTRMTTPPTNRATATVAGPKRFVLIQSCRRAPAMSAGTVVVRRSAQPRGPAKPTRAPGRRRSRKTRRSRTNTARMAPSWMKISKVSAVSPRNPRRCPATMRWPVDETGRNSVRPSTIPSRIAIPMRPMGAERTGTRAGVARARPAAGGLVLQLLHAGDLDEDAVPGDGDPRGVAHEHRLVAEPAHLARPVQEAVLGGHEPLLAHRLLPQLDQRVDVVGVHDLHEEIAVAHPFVHRVP